MPRHRTFLAAGLLIALAIAGIASGFASSSPDGLEKVATEQGFLDTATEHDLAGSPVAGYAVAGVPNERLSTGLAGIIGVAVTLAVSTGLFLALRQRAGARRSIPTTFS